MRKRDQIRAKIGSNKGLTDTPTPTFCLSSSKTKNKKLNYKSNSLLQESRLYLAYAISPLKHLVPPSGLVRTREDLQKIYPQNLKKKEKQAKKRKQRNTRSNTHKIYNGVNCTQFKRLYHPCNSNIKIYTSIICILRYFVPHE